MIAHRQFSNEHSRVRLELLVRIFLWFSSSRTPRHKNTRAKFALFSHDLTTQDSKRHQIKQNVRALVAWCFATHQTKLQCESRISADNPNNLNNFVSDKKINPSTQKILEIENIANKNWSWFMLLDIYALVAIVVRETNPPKHADIYTRQPGRSVWV